MIVSEVMNRNVVAAGPKTPLRRAVEVMNENRIGSLVVLEDEKVIGIITERDILRAIAQGKDIDKLNVEDIMTKNVITISPTDPIERAVELMTKHSIKKLPVLDGEKLVGIVTATDIIVLQPKLIENLAKLLSIRLAEFKGG